MAFEVIKTFSTICTGVLHKAINDDVSISTALEQIIYSGGTETAFIFEFALSAPEDNALDVLLASWACPVVEAFEATDAQLINSAGVESGWMTFNSDPTRNNKNLSGEVINITFSKSEAKKRTWVAYGAMSDQHVGYIAPFAGTIIDATGFVTDADNDVRNIDLYINDTNVAPILTFGGTGGQETQVARANNDFNAGDRIRLRADNVNSKLKKLAITLRVRWRTP